MHICMYIHMHVYVRHHSVFLGHSPYIIYRHIYMYVYIHIYTCMYVHTCLPVCIMYMYAATAAYIFRKRTYFSQAFQANIFRYRSSDGFCINIYVRIYTYIYIFTHIYIYFWGHGNKFPKCSQTGKGLRIDCERTPPGPLNPSVPQCRDVHLKPLGTIVP